MSIASKSPRKVAAVALVVGTRTFPRYGHRYSRRDFTLPQLFTLLVLRKFFKTDYRGIVQIVADWPQLQKALGLKKVPHFTTLQKVEQRLFSAERVRRLITHTVGLYHDEDDPHRAIPIEQVAADATGFRIDRASRYFVNRRVRSPDNAWQTTCYRDYGKLMVAVDCANHLILGTYRGMGPYPDVGQLQHLLRNVASNVWPEQFLADAGFDSETNHRRLRTCGIETIIPATIGRPSDKLPAGPWRALMATDFNDDDYGQRWQSETVMFMLKQHMGDALTARSYHARRREMGLIAVTHNVMIDNAQ
jgi:hypothetical protein